MAPRNLELFVQTVFYKENPYAFRNLVMMLLVLAMAFASMAFMSTMGAIVTILLLLAIPLTLSFVSGKKWFSFNAVYDEPLVFEPSALQVEQEYFSIKDMDDIVFYIHSFYGFRYSPSRLAGRSRGFDDIITGDARSEYGDKNELHFSALGKKYNCRFLLGSGTAWYAIYQIMETWKMHGKTIMLKEEFPFEFVHGSIAAYAQPG
jgi:hypothetical protein